MPLHGKLQSLLELREIRQATCNYPLYIILLFRRGARKLVKYFEPCGGAVDIQMVIFGKNKWVSYRTANPWSYQNNLNSRYPVAHDFTDGIFHQARIGSFNGH
jgi:hypothetical protein